MKRQNATRIMALFILLAISIPSFAQNKILKVSEKLKKVGLSVSDANPLKVGDIVEVSDSDEPCKIKIIKITPRMAIGKTSCDFLEDLKGKEVKVVSKSNDDDLDLDNELDSGADESQSKGKRPKDREKKKSKSGFGVALYYSTANEIEVNGTITVSPNPQTSFNEKISTDMGLGISLFYLNVPTGRLGSFVSVDYDLPRSMKSVSGTVGNTAINGTSSSKFSFVNLVSNLAYGATDTSILYAGISFPAVISVTNADGEKYFGSIGYQGGYAYRFNDTVFSTLEYRVVNGKETYSSGTTSGTADFKFNGFNLRICYTF